jgi:hypothetical protein
VESSALAYCARIKKFYNIGRRLDFPEEIKERLVSSYNKRLVDMMNRSEAVFLVVCAPSMNEL